MIGFDSALVAGTVLVRSAIQSPNYVAGTTGWTINQDGSVEFNNATIRGTITAGNGTVRLNNGGVKVDGTIYQYDINFTGGFLARRLPDDGGYAQMNMLIADGFAGGGIFMNPTDPTPNGNSYQNAGAIYSSTVAVGAVDAGFTVVRSPILNGGYTGASIFMYGENSDHTVGPRFSMNGDMGIHGNLSVDGVGHEEYFAFPGVSVTNSTTMVNVSGTTMTIEAGCTYKLECYAAYDGPTAGDARFCWTTSNAVTVSIDRHIRANGVSTTTNADTQITNIRRGLSTQQVCGTPAGVANAFSVYEDIGIVKNTGSTDEAIQLQFAQGTANATASLIQNGYMFLKKIAAP